MREFLVLSVRKYLTDLSANTTFAREDLSTILRLHTGAKSVPTFAHDIAGLKRSLQWLVSDKSPAPSQSSGVEECACSGRARSIRI